MRGRRTCIRLRRPRPSPGPRGGEVWGVPERLFPPREVFGVIQSCNAQPLLPDPNPPRDGVDPPGLGWGFGAQGWGLGFRDGARGWDLGFRAEVQGWSLGFRAGGSGMRFQVREWGLGFKKWGLWAQDWGSRAGFWGSGLGFKDHRVDHRVPLLPLETRGSSSGRSRTDRRTTAPRTLPFTDYTKMG